MNRKYVVIRAASNIMAEIVANQIYVEMDDAKAVADQERRKLVQKAQSGEGRGELGVVSAADRSVAERAAASFVKVYELVAVDL